MLSTDNYKKHTTKNPIQKFLIDNFIQTLIREVDKVHPQSILDVGCGEGFILENLRQKKIGKELTGIDFSAHAIEIGKKLHPKISIQHGNIYNLPFPADSFDLIICCEVLEHLEFPEKALIEIKRVTKNNCVISVPNEPWFMLANFLRGKNISRCGNDIEHIQNWSSRGISKLISKYFYITALKNPFPWSLVVVKK